MFGIQALVAATGLVVSLLSASCEVDVSATPVSLQVQAKGRYTPSPSLQPPCDMVVIYPDGSQVLYRDIDCDGIADFVLIGHRWIPLGQDGGQGRFYPGHVPPTPKPLPYFDPGYGFRNAEDLIRETGLDQLAPGSTSSQTLWLHRISTADWTMDVTVPSTSLCRRPDFLKYDVTLEWTVVPSEKGPDFEAWRVAGDLNEVLPFLVECGFTTLNMETPSGDLEVAWDEDANAINVTLNGMNEYWISLD